MLPLSLLRTLILNIWQKKLPKRCVWNDQIGVNFIKIDSNPQCSCNIIYSPSNPQIPCLLLQQKTLTVCSAGRARAGRVRALRHFTHMRQKFMLEASIRWRTRALHHLKHMRHDLKFILEAIIWWQRGRSVTSTTRPPTSAVQSYPSHVKIQVYPCRAMPRQLRMHSAVSKS